MPSFMLKNWGFYKLRHAQKTPRYELRNVSYLIVILHLKYTI